MRRLCVLLVVVLSAGGCAERQTSDDEAAIAKIRSDYATAADAQDAAALARLYMDDGIEMPPNMPVLKGRAAIEAYHKGAAANVKLANLKIMSTESRVLGDTAYDVGTYTQQATPQGGETFEDRGKYMVLLKRGPGGWAVSHAIYNSDLPPPQMPAGR